MVDLRVSACWGAGTIDHIEGSLVAGAPVQVIDHTRLFEDVGVDHLLFDTRLSNHRWFESIELLGREVLPNLR